ncbi:MAG: MarR family transcriptional regulator [Pseudanabaena sp.]
MSKFYQLQPDEWLTVCKELKPAELKVLYRLRTLDPFGQHPIKFRVVDLAKDLDMNKGTVSRAVQRLADLGYINLEIVEAIATLTTKSKKLSVDNSVVPTQPNSENDRLSTDNLVVYRQLQRSLHNQTAFKVAQSKARICLRSL